MSWGTIFIVLVALAVASVIYFLGMGAGYQDGAEDGYQAGFAAGKALNCEEAAK